MIRIYPSFHIFCKSLITSSNPPTKTAEKFLLLSASPRCLPSFPPPKTIQPDCGVRKRDRVCVEVSRILPVIPGIFEVLAPSAKVLGDRDQGSNLAVPLAHEVTNLFSNCTEGINLHYQFLFEVLNSEGLRVFLYFI